LLNHDHNLIKTILALVEWLVDYAGANLELVTDFKYPGHSQFRMHAPPSRTGAALIADLKNSVFFQRIRLEFLFLLER